ncbi:hypothetical protein AAG906_024881 [Vitis piasezkii]
MNIVRDGTNNVRWCTNIVREGTKILCVNGTNNVRNCMNNVRWGTNIVKGVMNFVRSGKNIVREVLRIPLDIPLCKYLRHEGSRGGLSTNSTNLMVDPNCRYVAPVDRGNIPRSSFTSYLLPDPYQRRDVAHGISPGIPNIERPNSLRNVESLPPFVWESNILFVDGLPKDFVHKEPICNSGDKAMVLCFVEFNDARCSRTALEKPDSPALGIQFAHFPFSFPFRLPYDLRVLSLGRKTI